MNDTKHMRLAGYLNGEPVYDMPLVQTAERKSARLLEEGCDDPECLACIINQLIEPIEDLDVFMELGKKKIAELDSIRIDSGTTALHVEQERRHVLTTLALAANTFVHLKAIIGTAARVFEDL